MGNKYRGFNKDAKTTIKWTPRPSACLSDAEPTPPLGGLIDPAHPPQEPTPT